MEAEVYYTDEALIAMVKNDDQGAFTILYRRYWEPLFETAAKVLRSKEEAADVVQDVFLSLWNRRHELDITGSPAAYLQTSIKYKAIHYIEKNITRHDYLALFSEMLMNYQPADAPSQIQLKELQQVIQHAVDQMPPKMREVYRLSRHEHLSHKEIADRLGISDETVKKHIQHALQQIKTAMGPHAISFAALLIHWLNA